MCDPALTDGCPPRVTSHAGIDALAHAIEAFTATRRESETPAELALSRVFVGKNALSDTFALEAIRRIGASLVRAVRNPGDRGARDNMAFGSLLAGFAFASAGTAAAHALQYPLGARTSTPHGLGIGILLPYTMEFNRPVRLPEFGAIASALDEGASRYGEDEDSIAAVELVATICSDIGIPRTLAELGLGVDDLDQIADQASGISRLIENNPRPLDKTDLRLILSAAWTGERTALTDDSSARFVRSKNGLGG